MPNLAIQSLNLGDTQEVIIDKVNSNFDSIVVNGGGPQGGKGDQGEQGSIGQAGPKGDPGQEGVRGTRWFVQSTEPTGGPGDPILVGDYWVQTISNNSVFEYSALGFVDTGTNLKASEVFELVANIAGPTGNKNAIVISSPLPDLNTVVLSDAIPTTATVNPTYSKLLISTNGTNDFPILEFSKTNAPGIGTPADYNRHPQFRWLSPAGTNYDLLFTVPQDNLEIRSGGSLTLQSTSSTLNILGNGGVNITSGSQMSFTSVSAMSFSSGSSLMTIASQKFNLTSSLFSLTVPLNITSTSPSTLLNLINNGTGDTLLISSSSASSSYFLLRLLSTGTERFSVRNDGKVTYNRTANYVSDAITSTPSFTTTISATTYSSWFYGPVSGTVGSVNHFEFGEGNTMYADWTTSNQRIIGIPANTSSSLNWSDYLGSNYESITLKYFAATGKLFNGITFQTGSPPVSIGAYDIFSSAASYVEVTFIRLASVSSYKIYWRTCAGECGILV